MLYDGIDLLGGITAEGTEIDLAELKTLDSSTGGNLQLQIDSKMDTTLLSAMNQDIVPDTDNVHSLGSLTHMWKDVYIGPGSLYINGQKLIEDNAGTINIHPDINQNLTLSTSGSGDVELSATGTGTIQLKSAVQVTAGNNIISSDGNPISVGSGFTMNGEKIENMAAPTIGTDAATKAYTDAAVNAVTSGIDWKEAVTNFADLATTYPTAVEGWTASVNSEDTVYRYDGASWVALANGTVPLATAVLDGKLSSSDFSKLAGIEVGATADQTKGDIDALGINAGTLDGATPSTGASNSTIVKRNSSGYVYANYFNTTPNDIADGNITKIVAEQGNDGFIRHATAATVRTFLNVENGATADQTKGDIDALGINAGTLDTLDSTQFLRSDTNDSNTAKLTFNTGTNGTFQSNTGSLARGLEIHTNNGNDAMMTFHVSGDYAAHFGLDASTNKFSVGGWSLGATSYAIYHEGNKPTAADVGALASGATAVNATEWNGATKTVSTSAPTGGSDGDIWFQYE